MDYQSMQNKIEELSQKFESISIENIRLNEELLNLKNKFDNHSHTETDDSLPLRDNIHLDSDKFLSVGGSTFSEYVLNPGSTSEQRGLVLSSGVDRVDGYVYKTSNMQMNFLHQPNNASKQSFLTMLRSPAVSSIDGQTVSTTAAGNTITINGFNFTTNELANCLINIYNSSGTQVESQTISSNTASVITISGTWANTTSSATFLIYVPVFMGSAEQIYQRFYTQEGTGGGIRFGVGPTNGGQNGLLYMDSVGDLFWRSKVASVFTAVAATNVITVTSPNFIIQDGVRVQFSTTATLPAGLSTGTTYYLINSSGATFKVATSRGGTEVDITDTGTGTHTVSSVGLN